MPARGNVRCGQLGHTARLWRRKSSQRECAKRRRSGGLAQQDSFDLKPDAPDTVRGEFNPIHTKTPGIEICEHLPLLAERKWFSKVPYGYARGWEPVLYVNNIRAYYDLLVWLTENDGPPDEDVVASS